MLSEIISKFLADHTRLIAPSRMHMHYQKKIFMVSGLSSAFTSASSSQPRHIRMGGNTLPPAVGEVSPLVIVFMRWTIVFAILLMTKRKNCCSFAQAKGKCHGYL